MIGSRRIWRGVGIGLALVGVVLLVLWRTNPPNVLHFKKLQAGPLPLELLDLSKLTPAQQQELNLVALKNHPKLATSIQYQNYCFFSTTSQLGGRLTSIGLLGMVFDLRAAKS